MEFLKLLERLVTGVESIATSLTGANAAGERTGDGSTPAPPVKDAPKPPVADAPKPPVEVTLADLNAAMVAKAGAMGDNGAAIFAMLQADFSVAGLNQLQPDTFADVLAKVNALES